MVSSYLVPLSTELSRALDDVHARAVVALHVEVAGSEVGGFSAVEVARDRERLEENLRHDDRAAEVEHDTPVVKARQGRGQSAKVAVAGVTNRSATGRWVLMNDFSPERGVHGAGNSEIGSGKQYGQGWIRQLLFFERASQRLAHPPGLLHSRPGG